MPYVNWLTAKPFLSLFLVGFFFSLYSQLMFLTFLALSVKLGHSFALVRFEVFKKLKGVCWALDFLETTRLV